MNKLFYVRAIINWDENSGSYIKRTVEAVNEEAAREIVAKELQKEIEETGAQSTATFEICKVKYLQDMN